VFVARAWKSRSIERATVVRALTGQAAGRVLESYRVDGLHDRLRNFGLVGDGAAGLELDRYELELGTPHRWVRSDTSPMHTQAVQDDDQAYGDLARVLYHLTGCRPGPLNGFNVVVALAPRRPPPAGAGTSAAGRLIWEAFGRNVGTCLECQP